MWAADTPPAAWGALLTGIAGLIGGLALWVKNRREGSVSSVKVGQQVLREAIAELRTQVAEGAKREDEMEERIEALKGRVRELSSQVHVLRERLEAYGDRSE